MLSEYESKASEFEEVTALQEVFLETKKLRKLRQPAHILIVEDDLLTRRIVARVLKENYAMISACNAHEAVANYLMHAPDVVFLDIGLPDVDGFTVLEQILAIDPDAFVVMFSSHDDKATISRALNSGAKGFIVKPFNREMLHQYIQGSAMHYHKYCA